MSLPMTGLRAWFLQRATAIYIGLFILYLLVYFAADAPQSFEEWRSYIGQPGITVSWALFFTALLFHAWVGMRDVVLDYVHSTPVRLTVLVAVAGLLVVQGFYALLVLVGAGP